MRQAAVAGPGVSQTVCKPRMEHAEQNLQKTAVEDRTYAAIAERNRTKAVAMSKTETFPADLHQGWLLQTCHPELLEIAVGPDVVIAREEIHLHTSVKKFLDRSKHPDISLRHHITILIPEIPYVTEHIHRLRILGKRTEKIGETAFTGCRVGNLEAQMDV